MERSEHVAADSRMFSSRVDRELLPQRRTERVACGECISAGFEGVRGRSEVVTCMYRYVRVTV